MSARGGLATYRSPLGLHLFLSFGKCLTSLLGHPNLRLPRALDPGTRLGLPLSHLTSLLRLPLEKL